MLIWLLVGRGIRGYSHLRRHPLEIFLLPLLALVVIMIALPIKLYAFVTMNKQGWLTRTSDRIGGEGQNAASLVGRRQTTAFPVEPAAGPRTEGGDPRHVAAARWPVASSPASRLPHAEPDARR